VKYDVAMVVTLFMMGLLVIAFVWGYSAGKSAAMKDGAWRPQAAVGGPEEKTAEKTAGAPPAPATKRPDDGEGIYCLQLMTSTRTGIEDLRNQLAEKGYPSVTAKADAASSKWVLYLGRFKTRQAADEYKKYLVEEEHAYDDALAIPRP
jgi:cell division protein FtsN